jgi:hypothetical protein
MSIAYPSFQQPRTLSGIGVSLAVHVLLIGLWQLARPVTVQQDGEPQRVQFLRLLPAPAPQRAAPALSPPARTTVRAARGAPAARATPLVEPQPLPEPAAEPLALPAEAPPAVSSADLLRAARAEAGAAAHCARRIRAVASAHRSKRRR